MSLNVPLDEGEGEGEGVQVVVVVFWPVAAPRRRSSTVALAKFIDGKDRKRKER